LFKETAPSSLGHAIALNMRFAVRAAEGNQRNERCFPERHTGAPERVLRSEAVVSDDGP
jgi:hypothetical protein